MSAVEMSDCGTNGSFQLQDIQIALSLFICTHGLHIGDDFQLQFMIFDDSFDGFQVEPNIICIEILEFLDTFEFLDVVRWYLSDFQKSHISIIIDDGAALNIGFCLVSQFHDIFGLCICHVLKDVQVDDCAKIVDVADKDNFLATSDQCVEGSAICEGVKDISVAGRIPRLYGSFIVAGEGKKRLFCDSWEAGLIECEDVDIVTLVFLNDTLRVVFGVERVHQDKRNVTVICTIQVLLLEKTVAGQEVPQFDERSSLGMCFRLGLQ